MGEHSNRSVAVVGSGPGGIYVAQALLEKAPGCHVDIIDKLPTPYGLVRGGVAPDHQHTKRVDRKYAETLEHESVRLVGNLALGRDVSLDELTDIYDAVVLAYGAPWDNRLGIPGEDKKGVYGSNAFVGWYNCHPDFRDLAPDLDIEATAVIGIGNVAIDVVRVLSRTPEEMVPTDSTSSESTRACSSWSSTSPTRSSTRCAAADTTRRRSTRPTRPPSTTGTGRR